MQLVWMVMLIVGIDCKIMANADNILLSIVGSIAILESLLMLGALSNV